MLRGLREFTLVHAMNAAQGQVAVDLWTKPIGLYHKPASRLPVNYTHHRHLFILSRKADTHYRPTEGRRLSQPSWLATYRDGFPARRRSPIQVLTGPGVYVDRDQSATAKPRHHLLWKLAKSYRKSLI